MFHKAPVKLLNSYSNFIKSRDTVFYQAVNFSKWFRFYRDFCAKYNFPDMDPDSLAHYLQKVVDYYFYSIIRLYVIF